MNPLLAALVAAGVISQQEAERINRSMDPVAMRVWAEQQIAIAMQNGLSAQQARLVELVRRGNVTEAALADFWRREDERLFAALRATLEQVGSEAGISMAVRLGADDRTWNLINERVLAWIDDYYINADAAAFGSIPNLNLTTRTEFARAYAAWQRGELDGTRLQGLPELIEALSPTFGPERAARIAITEGTRIQVESERRAAEADDNTTHYRFYTAADDRVCPVCGPLHMATVEKSAAGFPLPGGGRQYPPLHVNCRCRLIPESEATMRLPLPPEERYTWSAEDYAARQRADRQARQEAQRPPASAVDVLMGG